MKISLAQLNYHIGNFEGNLEAMLHAVEEARQAGSDIICFAELATCGYPPCDFLEFEDFIHQSDECLKSLRKASDNIAIVVGAPARNIKPEGKSLFNAAYFLATGRVQHVQHKTLLPTYDVFDEYRYFEPAKEWNVVSYKGYNIALTICEDIWDIDTEDPMYTIIPLDEMATQQPDLILNLSASPFSYEHPLKRLQIVRSNVKRYGIPLFYVNHSGAQTDLIFDGGSMVMAADGQLYDRMPFFETCIRHYSLDDVVKSGKPQPPIPDKIALICQALVAGLRDYFAKLGFKSAVLGLSGGIDSAVVATLAVEALGSDHVRALLMPSQFSSEHSVIDARALAENLKIQHDIIPIGTLYEAFIERLDPIFGELPFTIAEENIQARVRGILNMAVSNKFGNVLLNTTNKSEMAVGYGTLYGDLCGGLSVLGDVYKTEVYQLARYLNRHGVIIPENTITKPPSAELRPNQKDSDSLPEYELLDPLLYQYIEKRKSPNELIKMGFDPQLVKRVLRLVNLNEFKRYQTAPVLRVSPKAFGSGRRMPIVAKYLT
jgi:NAD+ synthase (glutamine-hydrolysing)